MSSPAVPVEMEPTITEEGDDFVIRIPKDVMSRAELRKFLDLVTLERGSRLLGFSDEEVEQFIAEAKRSAAERLRPLIEEKLRGG